VLNSLVDELKNGADLLGLSVHLLKKLATQQQNTIRRKEMVKDDHWNINIAIA
jgi:hypothetical protein